MTAHEDVFNGTRVNGLVTAADITKGLAAIVPRHLTADDVVFICIGTDRSTGDALGPLVGTYLTSAGYSNVVGTIDDPTHAMNLAERIARLPHEKTIIAIDAALGQQTSVGTTQVIAGSLKPGAGVNKELPSIGHYSVSGIVNVGGFMEFFVLQNTRLHTVMAMSRNIADALINTFPLEDELPNAAQAA